MPTERHPVSRHLRHRLSGWQQLSLEYGEANHRPGFCDDDARRAAWIRHRDWLMARCRHGWRPEAWWDYEAPIPRPDDYDYEKAALWEAGLLSPDERAELEATWHESFEEAQARGFTYYGGPAGRIPQGPTAERAHYRWAGIPHELIRRWNAARRRRDKTIRKLAAPEPV